jgi:hypothetical protein
MVRPLMVSGQWLEMRRHNNRLRLPDDVIGESRDDCSLPLEGLLAFEAETLAQLLGGRVPSEKELDYIVSTHPNWRSPEEMWSAWTNSAWSLTSYSLNRWNISLRRWECPDSGRARPGGDVPRTVLKWDGRKLVRLSCDPNEGVDIRAAVVFDV